MVEFDPWLAAASIAASATCLLHIFLGGHLVVPPLLQSPLRDVVKYTHYFCWHLVTMALAVMAAGLAWAAISPDTDARAAGWLAALLALSFMATNVAVNLAMKLSFRKHPQGALFLIISTLALTGLAHG